MGRVRRHAGIASGLYTPGAIDRLRDEWSGGRMELPIADVADWLQTQLGQQLTAYLAGVRDPRTVGRWRSGRAQPRAVAELRLRAACDAVHLVTDAYDARARPARGCSAPTVNSATRRRRG